MTAPDRSDLWLPTAAPSDEYLGSYRLIRKAGSGGMGVVYLAVDRDEHPVAVKVLREHLAEDAGARVRLRRELQAMQRVHDPHIAQVIDADLDGPRPYIVTEFVRGPQLDHHVEDAGRLRRDALVALGRGLASALSAIHSVGVAHRDLKPGNVLLDGGRPVVIDFGIARLADDISLTTTGLFMGTPAYVAPETIRGDPATPATDWWAWAAVMAYAATGSPPSGRGPVETVLYRIRHGELRLDGVDADLRPLLADCLSVDPRRRPAEREIRERLERYARGGTTAVRRSPGRGASRGPIGHSTAVLPTVGQAPRAAQAPPLRRPTEDDEAPQPARPQARARESGLRRPTSTVGPLLTVGALVVAVAMAMPAGAAVLLALLLTVARTIDRFVAGIRWREELTGSRRRALTFEIAASPWSALRSALGALLTMIAPALVAAGTTYVASRLLPAYAASHEWNGNAAVGLGAAAGLLALWAGPGARTNRKAAHHTLRSMLPTPRATAIFMLAIGLAVAAILIVVWRYPVLDWWPLSRPPTRGL